MNPEMLQKIKDWLESQSKDSPPEPNTDASSAIDWSAFKPDMTSVRAAAGSALAPVRSMYDLAQSFDPTGGQVLPVEPGKAGTDKAIQDRPAAALLGAGLPMLLGGEASTAEGKAANAVEHLPRGMPELPPEPPTQIQPFKPVVPAPPMETWPQNYVDPQNPFPPELPPEPPTQIQPYKPVEPVLDVVPPQGGAIGGSPGLKGLAEFIMQNSQGALPGKTALPAVPYKAGSVEPDEKDFTRQLAAARASEDQSKLAANISRAGASVAGAFSRNKPDYSAATQLEAQGKVPGVRLAEDMALERLSSQSRKAKQDEDPTSPDNVAAQEEVRQVFPELAGKMGENLSKMTRKQITDLTGMFEKASALQTNKYKAEHPGAAAALEALTPEGQAMLVDYLKSTGQLMPNVGRGNAATGIGIRTINAAAKPGDAPNLGGAKADYKANSAALTDQVKRYHNLKSFERTARLNLDRATELAKGMVDSGSPWLNKPIRTVLEQGAGDPQIAAFHAARQVALGEASRILNSATATGTVTDSLRNEVDAILSPNSTVEQFVAASHELGLDMNNRMSSFQGEIKELEGNLGIGGKRSAPEASPQGESIPPQPQIAPPATGPTKAPAGALNDQSKLMQIAKAHLNDPDPKVRAMAVETIRRLVNGTK